MHSTQLPSDVIERVLQRRGHLHPFSAIDPARTALVVIDMQNAFCAPGMILEVPTAREIVPNINRLAAATRDAGGLVAWVQMSIPTRADWPVFLGNVVPSEEGIARVLSSLQPGGDGHALWPELQVERARDLVVPKNRFSAFLPGACGLDRQLEERGIDTLLITGTLTNVCCEGSARDAAMRDYKVILVSDGNACHSDGAHTATLSTFIQSFGDVRSTDELVRMMAGASVPA